MAGNEVYRRALELQAIADKAGPAARGREFVRAERALVQAFADTKIPDDEVYWALLAQVFFTVGCPFYQADLLTPMLMSDRPGREWMMFPRERRALRDLPSRVTLFRGWQGRESDWRGYSWSPSGGVAHVYALCRWSDPELKLTRGVPWVAEARIDRDDILAFVFWQNLDRECEVIVRPPALELVGVQRAEVGGLPRWACTTEDERRELIEEGWPDGQADSVSAPAPNRTLSGLARGFMGA